MSLSDAPGWMALVISGLLIWWEWHRYRLPLQVKVREIEWIGEEGVTHLVVLHIAFVNPASAGKTVFHIALHQTAGTQEENTTRRQYSASLTQPEPYQWDDYEVNVSYVFPNHPPGVLPRLTFPAASLLRLPLDIPPHESRYLKFPLYVVLNAHQTDEPRRFYLKLDVQNVFGKRIAGVDEVLPLETALIL